MRIALVQFESAPGLLLANLERHLWWAQLARQQGAEWIAFPELSLTGYNPSLAPETAIELEDARLSLLQNASDRLGISIICGVPLKSRYGIQIGSLIVQPRARLRCYSKMYLHADEQPHFVPGEAYDGFISSIRLGIAICYEISVEAHRIVVMSHLPITYLASVAKTERGIEGAERQLASIATDHSLRTMMVNGVGICEEGRLGGRTSVWTPDGRLEASLDEDQEGMLISDL